MKDFITAALPWIIIGIAIALLAVNAGKRKKGEKKADDNMSEGMCIGMCIGVALGASGSREQPRWRFCPLARASGQLICCAA